MADVYNSKFAKLVKFISGNKSVNFGVTTSATRTRYDCKEFAVSPEHRAHEDFHKASIADRQRRKGKIYGWIDWMASYFWRNAVKGYDNNEQEIAANEAAKKSSTTGGKT